jgi:hypothetical protein
MGLLAVPMGNTGPLCCVEQVDSAKLDGVAVLQVQSLQCRVCGVAWDNARVVVDTDERGNGTASRRLQFVHRACRRGWLEARIL